jgi:hypothetical protein
LSENVHASIVSSNTSDFRLASTTLSSSLVFIQWWPADRPLVADYHSLLTAAVAGDKQLVKTKKDEEFQTQMLADKR